MNNTTAVIIGVIIVALLIIGGVFFYKQSDSSINATSTPTGGTTGTTPGTSVTAGAPVATTNANVTPTDTTAVVVGGITPNGALTTYWYEYGPSASLGSNSQSQTIGSGYTQLAAPAYIQGLSKDTTYSFRLVAQNQFGTSRGATQTFHTTVGTPAPVGGTPTARTTAATSIARTAANLNGQVTPNKAATTYWFEYGMDTSFGNTNATQTVGNGSAAVGVSFTLSGLAPANTYYYRLNAQNQFGTVNGATQSFKTLGPAASAAPVVNTLIASPVATTTATVRATVNPSDAQTTYWFEYSTDSLLGSVLLKTTAQKTIGAGANTTEVTANLSSLKPATNYYYRVVAQNASGTSRSEKLSFTTK